MAVKAALRWEAIRRAYEGEPIETGLIAAIAGVSLQVLRRRAREGGWRAGRGHIERRDRLVRLADRLTRQAEALGEAADPAAGRPEAVHALLRTIRLLSALPGTGALAEEAERDADIRLAAALSRIDRRIVTLARAHARHLVANGWRGDDSGDRLPTPPRPSLRGRA